MNETSRAEWLRTLPIVAVALTPLGKADTTIDNAIPGTNTPEYGSEQRLLRNR